MRVGAILRAQRRSADTAWPLKLTVRQHFQNALNLIWLVAKANMIEGISALLDAANGLFGWRSLVGLVGGALIAGALYFLRAPTANDLRPLIALVALCYFGGIILDLTAARARRRTTR